ncbi:MAG: smalltalk protein [Bacteroides sp]|nr:smalltalk protein [Bacteroides sp.]
MNNEPTQNNSTWKIILKVIVAVTTAIAGALGISACVG